MLFVPNDFVLKFHAKKIDCDSTCVPAVESYTHARTPG